LWKDGATAGNSLENRFSEYLTVASLCIGLSGMSAIFVPSGHFFNLQRVKNQRGLRRANKVDGPFL
jgi:hypothetical protein